jgi:MFS family permease
LLIAACIVLPQIIVALASPTVGRLAERHGRRIVLTIGLTMLPLRCLLFATSQNPTLLVAVQVFDGIAAACFGIMVPLIVSDVAGGSGHFNLSLGAVGFGIGIGGTLSTPAAGWMADHFGTRLAFFALTGIGIAAVLVASVMPETRPSKEADQNVSGSGVPSSGDAPSSDAPSSDAPSGTHGGGGDAHPSEPQESKPPGDAAPKPKPPTRRRA